MTNSNQQTKTSTNSTSTQDRPMTQQQQHHHTSQSSHHNNSSNNQQQQLNGLGGLFGGIKNAPSSALTLTGPMHSLLMMPTVNTNTVDGNISSSSNGTSLATANASNSGTVVSMTSGSNVGVNYASTGKQVVTCQVLLTKEMRTRINKVIDDFLSDSAAGDDENTINRDLINKYLSKN